MTISRFRFVVDNPWRFARRVVTGFSANQGFLLSGAVAYYTLLTIVPMFALILVMLSQIQDIQPLLISVYDSLEMLIPNQAEILTSQIIAFVENWKAVGITGILLLIFFSSFAFTSLENAMSVIFFHRVAISRRHFLISAVIPYVYILILAISMLMVSSISISLHALGDQSVTLMGKSISLTGLEKALVYLLGIVGEILLLSSLYLVMPVGRLQIRHAFIGGIAATLLWEITRHFLVWYFTSLSLVNLVYGTFATVIIILLSFEAAAIIVLLGAQVIAEYERIGSNAGQQGLSTEH